MNKLYEITLKSCRKLHRIMNRDAGHFGRNWKMLPNKGYAADLIINALLGPEPVMISRIGANEALCMSNYLGVRYPEKYKSIRGYIRSQTPPWWWDAHMIRQLHNVAGFFPVTPDKLEQFASLMLSELQHIDILGSWLKDEHFFREQLRDVKRVMLEDLEPFFCLKPWTIALHGKKVLVVHPFEQTIRQQFAKKDVLFDPRVLPDFQLSTLRPPLTLAGEPSEFSDWFAALDHMKGQLASMDFDICILGCGAYGLPLASFVKQLGKKAIHLGGVTQLLFGIKGKRWDEFLVYPYENLYNGHWVRPDPSEKPGNPGLVEGGCYW